MNDLSNPQNLFSNQPSKPQRVTKLQEHPILTVQFKQFLLENANKQSTLDTGKVMTRNADIIVVKSEKETIEKQRRNQVGPFAVSSGLNLITNRMSRRKGFLQKQKRLISPSVFRLSPLKI